MAAISVKFVYSPVSLKDRAGLSSSLRKIFRSDQISETWAERFSYGRDCNSLAILKVRAGDPIYPPDIIVWPENTSQLSQLAAWANEARVPLIPFGGGSGVCGGTWALNGGIAVDLKRMDKILELNTRKMQVSVQAGINGEVFERYLNRRGLTLGHFPSSIYLATVGGYLACRSAGQYSSRYGKIEDMVLSLEAVLADGSVVSVADVSQVPRVLDLKELFVGSEGTLGFMTEGTFRLHPLPEHQWIHGFSFKSLTGGLEAARKIMQEGLKPFVLRLYDPLDTLLASSYREKEQDSFTQNLKEHWVGPLKDLLKPGLQVLKDASLKTLLKSPKALQKITDALSDRALMVLGFHGPHPLVETDAKLAQEICESLGGKDLGPGPGQYWLEHRYSVSYKLSPLFNQGFFADTLETATSWKNLNELYQAVRKTVGKRALVLAHFSHVYAEGCSIYFTLVAHDPTEAGSQKLYQQIWDEALAACVAAGGTLSHHHGVGLLKAKYMAEEWGEALAGLRQIKQELDPHHILNPGKLGFSLNAEKEVDS